MVGTGILSNNMRSPSPECYTTFWMMTMYIDKALLIWALLPNLTFYLITRGFHRTFATGAACQKRMLTPPDTLSCPTFWLASALMLRPISPELVLSQDFWVSNIPRNFCFCFTLSRINSRNYHLRTFLCWNWRSWIYINIVAVLRGMHVSPAKHSYAWLPRKCDYRTFARTDIQTDGQTPDKVIPMCRYASQATKKIIP